MGWPQVLQLATILWQCVKMGDFHIFAQNGKKDAFFFFQAISAKFHTPQDEV